MVEPAGGGKDCGSHYTSAARVRLAAACREHVLAAERVRVPDAGLRLALARAAHMLVAQGPEGAPPRVAQARHRGSERRPVALARARRGRARPLQQRRLRYEALALGHWPSGDDADPLACHMSEREHGRQGLLTTIFAAQHLVRSAAVGAAPEAEQAVERQITTMAAKRVFVPIVTTFMHLIRER
jgi:hypothetical protein